MFGGITPGPPLQWKGRKKRKNGRANKMKEYMGPPLFHPSLRLSVIVVEVTITSLQYNVKRATKPTCISSFTFTRTTKTKRSLCCLVSVKCNIQIKVNGQWSHTSWVINCISQTVCEFSPTRQKKNTSCRYKFRQFVRKRCRISNRFQCSALRCANSNDTSTHTFRSSNQHVPVYHFHIFPDLN